MAGKRHIEDIFRERLEHAEATPPPGIWDAIEKELDQGASSPDHGQPYRQAAISRSGWMAMAFLTTLGLAGYLTWFLSPSASSDLAVAEVNLDQQQMRSSSDLLSNHQEASVPAVEEVPGQAAQSAEEIVAAASVSASLPSVLPSAEVTSAHQAADPLEQSSLPAAAAARSSWTQAADCESYADSQTHSPATHSADSNPASGIGASAESGLADDQGIVLDQGAVPLAKGDIQTQARQANDRDAIAPTLSSAKKAWNEGALAGFYGGLSASLMHTSLLSESAVVSDINLDPVSRVGASWGFTFGYHLNSQLALETGLIVESRQGSDYNSVLELNTVTLDVLKRIQLVYSQIPLTVRYRPGGVYSGTGGLNYVAGLQYGYMRNSRLAVEDRPVSPDRDLQKHDFAVLFGLDYDLRLSSHMFMSLGARASVSANKTRIVDLQDVNQDKRNALFGLRAALNYSLGNL